MVNVKLYIDFWNFQLSWNRNIKPEDTGEKYVRISWRTLPQVLISELPSILGPTSDMQYKGTSVYASVDPRSGSMDMKLKGFLHNTLGQMTGYKVTVHDRRPKMDHCPHCSKDISRTVEKGVDSSIITDLFAGALGNAYDIAVLVSNDSDFVPAISTIQERLNKQIVHIGFRYGGDDVRTASWSHIILDGDVAGKLRD